MLRDGTDIERQAQEDEPDHVAAPVVARHEVPRSEQTVDEGLAVGREPAAPEIVLRQQRAGEVSTVALPGAAPSRKAMAADARRPSDN